MSHRFIGLDLARCLAAHCIVLHHLVLYGPVPRKLETSFPDLFAWLDEYGRMAVQVFLVMGGLLFARALPASLSVSACLARMGHRYVRLFMPFMVAVLCAATFGGIVRRQTDADWVPGPLDLPSAGAHLTGSFDYLGIEPVTAGAWYVAIDWQLHALGLFVFCLVSLSCGDARHRSWSWAVAVLTLTAASLFVFNRDARWDVTPLYFFGAFAIGIAAWWLIAVESSGTLRAAAWGVLLMVALALATDFRPRLAVAALTGLWCVLVCRGIGRGEALHPRHPERGSEFDRARLRVRLSRATRRAISAQGDLAYALFLVHYPWAVLVNALYLRFAPDTVWAAALAFAAAWLLSLPLAWGMHRFIELPTQRWLRRERSPV